MAKEETRGILKSHAKAFIGFIAFILVFTAVWSWLAFEKVNLFPYLGAANTLYIASFFAGFVLLLILYGLHRGTHEAESSYTNEGACDSGDRRRQSAQLPRPQAVWNKDGLTRSKQGPKSGPRYRGCT